MPVGALSLYVVVAISGGAVLALEMLGTRVLGPFYGVSLFLWSALISVTLAALSVGYALGGRWADRGPRASRLGVLLAAAGAWCLIVPYATRPVLLLTEGLGLRAAVLVAAFVLFAPPLTLLGMVSPYAIRLKASSLQEVGRTAGDLYAISTLASVAAAVCTGFFLIPSFGVQRLVTAVGIALFAAAGIALRGAQRKPAVAALLLIPILAGSVLAARFPAAAAAPERGLLTVEHSPYAELRVVDRDGARYLLIDGGVHTIMVPDSWITLHPYAVVVDVAKHFFQDPGRMLLVGLGGGSVVKSFARDGWDIDAVEIDAAVTRLARTYFGLGQTEARVHHADGRSFVRRHAGVGYDLVVLDAFGSSSIPFHLVTREAFGELAACLAQDGVAVLNVETVGWDDPLVAAFGTTLRQHFSTVLALPIAEPPNALGNLILLAANRPLEIAEGGLGSPVLYLAEPDEHWAVVKRNHAWDNRFAPPDGIVLTDDKNPVDVWAERINHVARVDLHRFWGNDGRGW